MSLEVDALNHLDLPTRAIVEAWSKREPHREIPFTPLRKPLSECRVALLSSAGMVRLDDTPFDQDGERRNPWWGDPTFRVIPKGVRSDELRCCHLHINGRTMESDVNCALPVDRLQELAAEGVIGEAAPRHISTMGYVLHTDTLEKETAPAVAALLREDGVDAVVLAPV